DASFKVSHDITQRQPTERKSDGVVLAQFRCAPGKPSGLADVQSGGVAHPAVHLANNVTERRDAMGRSEIGVKLYRPCEQPQRLGGGVAGHAMRAGQAAEEIVVSIET